MISDFPSLSLAIQHQVEDSSVDFTQNIQRFVNLAEDRLMRDIDPEELRVTVTVPVTPGSPLVPKPSGYRVPHHLKYDGPGGSAVLSRRTPDFILDYWPDPFQTGTPRYWTDEGSSFKLAPTPSGVGSVSLKATIKPTYLSSSNPTNIFIEKYANALFYGSMVESCKHTRSYDQMTLWEQDYVKAVTAILNETRRTRTDDTTKTIGSPSTNNILP